MLLKETCLPHLLSYHQNQFMKFLTLIAITLFSFNLRAQITVDNTITPTQMVQDVLLGGGISVSNVTYTGAGDMRGKFSGTSNLGMEEGILLVTGSISGAQGPNNSGSFSAGGGIAGDNDLSNLISGAETNDASVLEFDFIPSSDTIRFFYVFGSEEYAEFVCSSFNDVFGFFLSGPDPAGGNYVKKNLAIIPGTTTPVAINSINPGSPGGSYDASDCISLAYSSLYTDNTGGQSIQYDGFTHILEASALVVACQTYHIKIAIADVSDGAFDSGVFLKAKSFSSPGISISAVGSSFDSTMIEGCGYASYIFTRSGSLADPYTINYIIGGTAANGTDYTDLNGQPIPSSITFPSGEDTIVLNINPVNDNISEPTEKITIAIPQILSCVSDTVKANIYITNVDPLSLYITGDSVICSEYGESTQLQVHFTGGYGPFTYLWSGGLSNDSLVTVSPTQTTLYSVNIHDDCGNESTSVNITVHNECTVLAYNIVTPNGDGKNDRLVFKNIELFPESELTVFNRWGKVIYHSNSYDNSFDFKDYADGTYFFVLKKTAGIEVPAADFHGTVTVLRK